MYDGHYILKYIYKYIFYSNNFKKNDTHPILKIIKTYDKSDRLIAEIAFDIGNCTTALLNNLSKDLIEYKVISEMVNTFNN